MERKDANELRIVVTISSSSSVLCDFNSNKRNDINPGRQKANSDDASRGICSPKIDTNSSFRLVMFNEDRSELPFKLEYEVEFEAVFLDQGDKSDGGTVISAVVFSNSDDAWLFVDAE